MQDSQSITYHLLAIILRAAYEPESIEFLTSQDESLQLGVMRRPKGHVITPHLHKPVERTVQYTYEALYLVRGRVEVTFFNERPTSSHEPRAWHPHS